MCQGDGTTFSVEQFVSRVLVDPSDRVNKGGGVSDSSSAGKFDGSSTGRKKPKFVRPKKLLTLAIGDRVTMEEAPLFVDRALVGHARGRNLSIGFLRRWVESNWSNKLPSLARVSKRMKGWFMFMMLSKEKAESVLSSLWEMAGVPIVLWWWSPIFDVALTKSGKKPIWVRLPGLHVHLWTSSFFQLLGNHMGKFIDVDYSFKLTGEMAMASILVLLDLREGLVSNVNMTSKFGDFTQILDYEGVPFRCHRCHLVNHLVAQCDKPFYGKWMQTGRKEGAREDEFFQKRLKGQLLIWDA